MLLLPSELLGELVTDEEALDAPERMDSSLIFVFSGSKTLAGLNPPVVMFSMPS